MAAWNEPLTSFNEFRLDRKFSAWVFDGLEAVEHEHLLELHAVSHDLGDFRGELRVHGNRIPVDLGAQQHKRLVFFG
jgi:hypothetical protein